MAGGRVGERPVRPEWWTWAALSLDVVVVALSLLAVLLAVASTTNRQEEVALRAIVGVPVAACAAVALSVQTIRNGRGVTTPSKSLVVGALFVVVPLGLIAAWFVYWVFTA